MAEGRKHDESKIIKNPLLSQSLLLEELSGVSFIVPAPSQKTQNIEPYGSKTAVDVPPYGAKKQGSPITQERGGIKDVPQSSQSFTDIPLNISDLKTNNNDKAISFQDSGIQSRKEAEPGLFKSSAASLLSLLVPPAPSNPPNDVKEEVSPSLGKAVQLGPKRQPSPQTFEPQLIPPTTSELKIIPVTLSLEIKEPDNPNLSNLTTTSTEPATQIKPPEKLFTSEPPKVPFPLGQVQNNTTLKNPYALRNAHNTISSVSHLSKSPPSSLGTSVSIPLYSAQNVSNLTPFNFFSGPPVVTPSGSETSSVEPNANVHSDQITRENSSSLEMKTPVYGIQIKPGSLFQNNVNEQNSTDIAPHTPFNMKIFSPPTSSYYQNIHSSQIPETKASEALTNVSLGQSVHSVPTTFTSPFNHELNTQHAVTESKQPTEIPKLSVPAYNSSVPYSTNYSSQTKGKTFPHSEFNDQTKNPELKLHTDIPSQIPETRASEILNNVSLNQSINSSPTFTSPVNQELAIQNSSLLLSKQPTEIQNTVSDLSVPTCDSSNAFLEAKSSELKPTPLISVGTTNLPSSSEFQKKLLQETNKNVENVSSNNKPHEIGTSMFSNCEIQTSDKFHPSSDITFKHPTIISEEKLSFPLGFQSKQVDINNIPLNGTKNAETNCVVSKDSLVGNRSLSQQSGNVNEIPSLSSFFANSQASTESLKTENLTPFISKQSVAQPYLTSLPVSDLLTPTAYFQQVPSSMGWSQQIPESIPSVLSNASSENILTAPDLGATVDSYKMSNLKSVFTPDPKHSTTTTITTPLTSDSKTNIVHTFPSGTPSLYPQPVYTFPKLDSNASTYPFSHQQATQPLTSFPPALDKTNPPPVNPLVPTFNCFSSPQTSCLPPSLDEPMLKATAPNQNAPSSYYFKPIQTPDSVAVPFLSQSSVPTDIQVPHQVLNPAPSAPPKTLNFPPPNVCYPKDTTFPIKQQTHAEVVAPLPNADNQTYLDGEELDQIPLEGSAVPLFNPESINRKKKTDIPVSGNTFRLSGGLKRRTYAPVPDLGVTERRDCPPPTSPSGISVSSQEEMAAIHENQNQNNVMSTPPKTPESTTVLDKYLGSEHATVYRPSYHHWFFKCGRDKKSSWTPFSMADSLNLEQVFTSSELYEDTKVATDGGRYDVEILRRKKLSVYWDEPAGEVRRCSWFVKSVSDSRYVPYDENIAALLEDEYKQGCETNEWNRQLELADGEVIILHGPSAIAHHVRSATPDAWSSQPPLQQRSRVVKRGVEDFDIPKGEPKQVDHLLLVVHGIGKACDLRFRSLVDVVDDFRSISLQLVQSHFHSGVQNGNVGRVEVLPVEWHKALHTETIDDRLTAITLPSIPRAREFTNETLLDILFYTSPVFCEKIVQAVGDELNRVFALYQKRNPGFRGQVSLGGHSLGSLILFDMLCHQRPVEKTHVVSARSSMSEDDEEMDEVGFMRKARLNRRMSYLTIGPGTGQPYTIYPQLLFQPKAFFALGSPIGMFITVRGVETLGEDFKFPTCPAFFNIFHPNDPVAYRIEALIKSDMANIPAVLIPHHKGRKRMHLELKETMAHVTAALKQKLVDSMKNTWNAVYQLALFNRKDHTLQGEVNKVIEDEVLRDASYLERDPPIGIVGEEDVGNEVKVGKLNDGRRIDYVLQEAPLETFNQYISAIRSHLVYWESEDTMLMILKEIYAQMGISPDSQVPQPILPFDISGDSETYSEYTYSIGAPPTQFVRK